MIKHPPRKQLLPFVLITFAIFLFVGLEHLEAITASIRAIITVFMPFIIGGSIAFVLNIPLSLIEDYVIGRIHVKLIQRYKRSISLVITLLLVTSILMVILILVIPELSETFNLLVANLSTYIASVGNWLADQSNTYPEVQEWLNKLELDWAKISANFVDVIREQAQNVFLSTFDILTRILSSLISLIISIVFALYILFQKEKLVSQFKQILFAFAPVKYADRTLSILDLINDTFSNFITGQCTEAILLGVIYFGLLTLLKFPYPLLISLIIAFMSFIPVLGGYLSSYTSAFLILTVSPIQALWFLVLFAVVSQLDNSFLYPHVVQNAVGLPSIWIVMSVTIGGHLMGIAGMVIFIPICSILYTLFREYVKVRLDKKKIDVNLLR